MKKTNGENKVFGALPCVLTRGLVVAGFLLCASSGFAQALSIQTISGSGTAQTTAPDSIVQITADAIGLQAVAYQDLPLFGTYWEVMPGSGMAPLPCPPSDPTLPIYAITDNIFLVDATYGQVVVNPRQTAMMSSSSAVTFTLDAQATAVANLIEQVQMASALQQNRSMAMASGLSDPPDFGDGGGGPYTPDALTNTPPDYGTNLWIARTAVASGYLTGIGSNTLANVPYTIQSRTNLMQSDWQFDGTIYGSQLTNWTPLSVAQGSRTNLFIRLRSELSGDGSSIPNWWEALYGLSNVDLSMPDSVGDGWTIYQKYQRGVAPNTWLTPATPEISVNLHQSSQTATINWLPSLGNVTNYTVEKTYRHYPWESPQISNTNISASTTSYQNSISSDVVDVYNGYNYNVSYRVKANYQNGNSSAWSAPVPLQPTTLSASITAGANGTTYLAVSGVPANAAAVRVVFIDQPAVYHNNNNSFNISRDIPVSSFTNGLYPLSADWYPPATDAYGTVDYAVFAKSIDANGNTSMANLFDSEVGWPTAHYNWGLPFYDGRVQLKQNLIFQLRAAPVDGSFKFGYYGQFSYPTNYATASFYQFANPGNQYNLGGFDAFLPFEENYLLRNFVLSMTNVDTGGNLTTGVSGGNGTPYYALDNPAFLFSTNLTPYQALLSTNSTHWLLYDQLNDYDDIETVGIISTSTDDQGETTISMPSGSYNWFGLPYRSINVVGADYNSGNLVSNIVMAGHSSTSWDFSVPYNIYSETVQPQFQTIEYDFWNSFDWPNPRSPLPGDPNFSPTNTSQLLATSVGNVNYQVASYAKLRVANSVFTSGVYGYLGQYFDKAYKADANGNVTTNQTGLLSPYGNFFATEPGATALVTMPDPDTGARGTCMVYCVSMQIDKNHDGTMDMSFNGRDTTSQADPMEFWVNNGHSESWDLHNPSDRDMPVPPAAPNYAPALYFPLGHINCERDLENFARLWLCGMPALTTNYQVTLSWQNCVGTPAINLYNSIETNGGIGYLTDTNIAFQQCLGSASGSSPYSVVFSGPNVCIANITTSSSYTFPAGYFTTNSGNNYFLFEGSGIGSGELTLTISQNDRVILQTGVWLDLHDVQDMFEHAHIVNAPSAPPYSTLTDQSAFVEDNYVQTNATDNKQLIVFVHGWRLTPWVAEDFAKTMFKRLWWQGYQGRFSTLHWPTLSSETDGPIAQYLTFNRDEYIAFKCAQGTANYFTNLQARFPGYSINACSHSHGNIIMMEALKRLLASGQKPINNYVMMQAAVAAECLDTNYVFYPPFSTGRNGIPDSFYGYAGPIQNAINGHISNFYNVDDFGVVTCWQPDQLLLKPDGRYWYGYFPDGPYQSPPGSSRQITDPQELMAFMSRPNTQAVGAAPNLGGAAYTTGQVNLQTLVGFSGNWDEHSGEFNWNYQRVVPFYHTLGQRLGVIP